MADNVDLLLQHLQETIKLLRKYKIDFWADWLQRDFDWIADHDSYGLTHLQRAFGGMGSFSDIMIHPMNGHLLSQAEIKPVNEHLSWLQGEIYRLSFNLKREVESS